MKKNKLPSLSKIQRRVLRDIIDAGTSSIVKPCTMDIGLCRKRWGPFCFLSPLGPMQWIGREHTATIRALIRKDVLVPKISDKEFSVQYALGTSDIRHYRLVNKQRWERSFKDEE